MVAFLAFNDVERLHDPPPRDLFRMDVDAVDGLQMSGGKNRFGRPIGDDATIP